MATRANLGLWVARRPHGRTGYTINAVEVWSNTWEKPMAWGPGATAPEAPRTMGNHENKSKPYKPMPYYIH